MSEEDLQTFFSDGISSRVGDRDDMSNSGGVDLSFDQRGNMLWVESPTGGGYTNQNDRWVWQAEHSPPVASEVRISFNRSFTWSEREAFREVVSRNNSTHYWINPSTVYIYSVLDSRKIVDKISEFVAQEYLNIHPRAVRTFYPEVIV